MIFVGQCEDTLFGLLVTSLVICGRARDLADASRLVKVQASGAA